MWLHKISQTKLKERAFNSNEKEIQNILLGGIMCKQRLEMLTHTEYIEDMRSRKNNV